MDDKREINKKDGFFLLNNELLNTNEEEIIYKNKLQIIYPSNFIYELFFTWIFSSLYQSKKNKLNISNLKNISKEYRSEKFFNQIFKNWRFKSQNSNCFPLISSIIYSNLFRFLIILFLGIIIALLEIFFVFLFKELMIYFQGEKWRKAKFGGKNLIILILSSKFIYIFIFHHKEFQSDLLSAKITLQINTLIYDKIYKVKMYLKGIPSYGRLIDFIQNDSEYFGDFLSVSSMILIIPLQIGYYFYLLFQSLGKSFIIGFVIFIIIIIILIIIQIIIKNEQRKYMKAKDSRIQMVSKVFYNIKNIKLNVWEEIFENKINEKRKNEIKYFSKLQYLQLLLNSIQFSLPPIISVTSILFYRLNIFNEKREEEKEMSDTLSDINLFFQITQLIFTLPDFFTSFFNCLVSSKRLEEFLFFEEQNMMLINEKSHEIVNLNDIAISINNCNFGIKKDNLILLHNINLEIKKGELIGIIGDIGSGKTNFLNAITNNLDLLNPSDKNKKIQINGKINYVPQIPFIINDTSLNNIIFNKEFINERYEKIIEICQLKEDFFMMEGGDKNEIGENGSNLSSGQKARISLARSFYSNDDIFLFDDLFNVLDINVGLLIFKKGIKEFLKDKTRIFVNNSLQYLHFMDKILYLEKGKIKFFGKFQDFSKSDLFFKINEDNLIKKNISQNNNEIEELDELNKEKYINELNKKTEFNKLIIDEDQKKGIIAFEVWKLYVFCIGGIIIFILLTIGHFILKSFELGKEYYSSIIEEDEEEKNFWRNLIILSIITFLGRIVNFFIELISVKIIIKCNINIHNSLIKNIINAPINTFHDLIPREQIINRLDGDLDNTVRLITITNATIRAIFQVIGCLIIFGNFSLLILLITPFIILLEIILVRFYLYGGRDLNRLEGISRSPVIKIFTENINGLKIIKCSKFYENIYIKKYYKVLNQYFKVKLFKSAGQNWFGIHLNILTYILLIVILLVCLYMKKKITPYKIGLLLSYSFDLNDFLYNTMNRLSRFEKLLTSIERCKVFMDIPSENINNLNNNTLNHFQIKFINFSVKYRPNCKIVLNNINLEINEKEKIGIVGRTGSGKTTLCLSLFRIIEEFKGRILIDNIDIRDINLKTLRKFITFIPQEPFIVEGTLKECIDPFDEYDEKEIMEYLNNVGLNYLINERHKLMTKINDKNIKLSLGEKHLLCLCHALLKKSKIIILDEPHSNMDRKSEILFHNCIQKYLSNSTLITITHKINSLMKYDKILVIDKGIIIEYDTPEKLILKENGLFRKFYKKFNILEN